MSKHKPNKVAMAKREVIQGKLLAALDDDDKVAIVLSEEDLDLLIEIVALSRIKESHFKIDAMWADLRQLRKEAFGR